MDRPARITLVISVVLFVRGMVVAQEVAPAVEPAENAATLKRERAISPRMAALLAATGPKYDATKSAEPAPAPLVRDKPANGIVRLPDYIVREPKLPTAEQVMTHKAIAQLAMNKYLGPSDGFDRGFLNAFTIADLRKKMGVLGYLLAFIPSMTNEERAMMYYYEDERLRKMNDLLELAALARKPGVSPADDKLKREIDKTFMRDSGFGR